MRKEIENWLKQAEHDMDVAKNLFEGGYYEYASFYCQQASEKALKFLLLRRDKELIKTHDLVLLARRLDAPANISTMQETFSSIR